MSATVEEKITTLGEAFYDKYYIKREEVISNDLIKMLENERKRLDDQAKALAAAEAAAELKKNIAAMNIQEFDSFTIFGEKKNYDIVRGKADNFFLENVQYHINPKVLEILGWSKPNLNADRLKIINDSSKNKAWYEKYARLWTVLLADDESELKGKIKSKIIKEDLQKMSSSKVYVRQMMLIYNYAYCDHMPKMALYMRNKEESKKWAQKAKEYYLSEEYGKIWMGRLQEQQKNQNDLVKFAALLDQIDKTKKLSSLIPKDCNSLDWISSDIRAKVDILDPSGKTSTEIISYLNNISLYNQILEGGANDEEFEKHLESNIETLFKGYKDHNAPGTLQQPIVKFVKDIAGLPGGTSGAIKTTCEVVKAIKNRYKVYITTSEFPLDVLRMPQIETEIAGNVVEAHPQAKKLSALPYFRKIFASLFRSCQAMIIFIGISNFDPSGAVMSNVQFIGDSMAMLGDFFTSFDKVNKYVTAKFGSLANRLGPILAKFSPAKLGQFFSKHFTRIFTSTANDFITYRICPVLLLVACYNNICDAKTSFEEKNWGGLACDLVQLGCNLIAAAILLAGIPFAAVGALVLGALAVGFYLIKIIFFPAKTPMQKYYESEYFPKNYKKVPAA